MFDFLPNIFPFGLNHVRLYLFPFSILTGHAVAELKSFLFLFYFNGVMLSLKLKSFLFYFILTGHAVAEAQVIFYFILTVILSLKLKSFLVCRFQHDKVYHVYGRKFTFIVRKSKLWTLLTSNKEILYYFYPIFKINYEFFI
jgi:hypothetical protein